MEVEIQIRIRPKDTLFIGGGSGRSGIGVDAATVRQSDGGLMIPGSTFKGRLRNECERIARALGRDVCPSPLPDNMCPHYFLKKNDSRMDYCIICRMFGSPWLRSSLRFSDLAWKMPRQFTYEEWKRIAKTEVRPGVSLSRYTRAKKGKELFFTEVMKTGMDVPFEGKITGSLGTNTELALLIGGLKTMFAVGGMKSRGLGWIEVLKDSEGYEVTKPEFDDSDFQEELEKWEES